MRDVGRIVAMGCVLTAGLAIAQPPEQAPEPGEAPAENADEAGSEDSRSETSASDPNGDRDAASSESESSESEPEPQSLTDARERLQRGEQLFGEENYDAALVEFTETLALLGEHPMRFLVYYNIGRSYERLFRYGQAMSFYRRFLEEGGNETELAGEVRAKIEALETLLGTVLVNVVNVERYEVWVDDRLVGTNAREVLMPGGNHVIEVRAEGFVAQQTEVQLPARAERTVTFELEELAEEFKGIRPGLFWASAGLTAVSLLGGAVLGLVALLQHQDLANRQDDSAFGGLGEVEQSEIDRMLNLALGADILLGATVLFATSTVILGVFTNFEDEDAVQEEARVRLVPHFGRRDAGLSLRGSF